MPLLGFIVKVKKILECICVNCGRLKADSVSDPFFRLSRFAPHHPIFWGLSPNSWRTPNPHRVSLRQSRRSSTRDEVRARFRSLDRRAVHCTRPVMVGHVVCVVKWGAERGVRKAQNGSLACKRGYL